MRVGINGFGRMGRLALRAGFEVPELEFAAVNEPGSARRRSRCCSSSTACRGAGIAPCSGDGGGSTRRRARGIRLSHRRARASPVAGARRRARARVQRALQYAAAARAAFRREAPTASSSRRP